MTPKSKGGYNRMDNLALLHETCHTWNWCNFAEP
ncbi:MAG: HNH endonuclease [Desulfamplus sp.]|nr:HNH endonuclease [Desulfamplus sp.]